MFYSNVLQTKDKCSHSRASELLRESLTTNFTAIRCSSYRQISQNRCTFDNVTAMMGGDIMPDSNRAYGVFYLETTGSSPFVIPDINSFDKITISSEPDTGEDEEKLTIEMHWIAIYFGILTILVFAYFIYKLRNLVHFDVYDFTKK